MLVVVVPVFSFGWHVNCGLFVVQVERESSFCQ